MKKCIRCRESKEVSEYYKHPQTSDGYLGKCKKCCRKDSLINRDRNIDRVRAYDRQRGLLESRRLKCREYAKKEKGARVSGEAKRRWASRNREKVIAQSKVATALRSGSLKRKPCVVCGEFKSEGHHEDYNKPLSVIWLCREHHAERHREVNEKEGQRNVPGIQP